MVDLRRVPFATGVERTRLHLGLLVGDVAVIVLLLSAGMLRHDENPLDVPERALLVVGPFVAAWLAASVVTGAYTMDTRASVVDAVVNAAGTWTLAALVGVGLRATSTLPGNAPPSFVAVMVGTGVVALGAWRGLVTAAAGPAGR